MVDIAPTFIRTLITDVIVAQEQLAETDDQPRRRNLIRTRFAAAEGLVWLLRGHVREVATAIGDLSPLDALALRDAGYAVSEAGVLKPTTQFMTLTTAIRHAVRLAQSIEPGIAIDFAGVGWSSLREAIRARNGITHPKTADDLLVTTEHLESSAVAFGWLLATVEAVMKGTNAAFGSFDADSKALLAALKRRDPEALRLYDDLLNRDDVS